MKRVKLCFQIGIAIILVLICASFLGVTVHFLYMSNPGNAGVFAALLGISLTIFLALVPLVRNKFPKSILIERYLNDEHFVDRDVEYTRLANFIKDDQDRIIYIAGNLGMGKTLFMKMSCDRINYTDKKSWKSYAAFYFNNNYTKTISQAISNKFCGRPNASVQEISKQLHNATLRKNIILFIDNISVIAIMNVKNLQQHLKIVIRTIKL